MARMNPLPADARPELAATFATFERILGVVPNSLLTMQRRPRIVAAFEALTEAVMDPKSAVDPGLKRLAAHMASRAAGCQYGQAHSLVATSMSGISDDKITAILGVPHKPALRRRRARGPGVRLCRRGGPQRRHGRAHGAAARLLDG